MCYLYSTFYTILPLYIPMLPVIVFINNFHLNDHIIMIIWHYKDSTSGSYCGLLSDTKIRKPISGRTCGTVHKWTRPIPPLITNVIQRLSFDLLNIHCVPGSMSRVCDVGLCDVWLQLFWLHLFLEIMYHSLLMDLNQTPYLMYFDKILYIFVDLFTYPTIARVSIVIRVSNVRKWDGYSLRNLRVPSKVIHVLTSLQLFKEATHVYVAISVCVGM